jgi:hypothetical protein
MNHLPECQLIYVLLFPVPVDNYVYSQQINHCITNAVIYYENGFYWCRCLNIDTAAAAGGIFILHFIQPMKLMVR